MTEDLPPSPAWKRLNLWLQPGDRVRLVADVSESVQDWSVRMDEIHYYDASRGSLGTVVTLEAYRAYEEDMARQYARKYGKPLEERWLKPNAQPSPSAFWSAVAMENCIAYFVRFDQILPLSNPEGVLANGVGDIHLIAAGNLEKLNGLSPQACFLLDQAQFFSAEERWPAAAGCVYLRAALRLEAPDLPPPAAAAAVIQASVLNEGQAFAPLDVTWALQGAGWAGEALFRLPERDGAFCLRVEWAGAGAGETVVRRLRLRPGERVRQTNRLVSPDCPGTVLTPAEFCAHYSLYQRGWGSAPSAEEQAEVRSAMEEGSAYPVLFENGDKRYVNRVCAEALERVE